MVIAGISQYYFRQSAGISIAGIPIRAELMYRDASPAFAQTAQRTWYTFSFDIDRYREQWKQLASRLNPESLSEYGKQYQGMVQSFKEGLKNQYRGKVEAHIRQQLDSLTGGINPAELAGKSPEELSALLLGKDIQSLLETAKEKLKETEQYTMLQEQKDSVLNGLRNQVSELEAKQKYIARLAALLKAAEKAGDISNMKELYSNATREYMQLLNNPQELARRMADKLNLGGIEKLFTLLSQFKLGGQQVPFAEQAVTPMLSKGVSFEINIKDKYIGFAAGRLFPVMNNLVLTRYDSLMNQQAATADKAPYWHVDFRKGKQSETHKGVKLTSVRNQGIPPGQLQPPDIIRKSSLLVNLYSRERLFGNNWLNAELSKSITISPNQTIYDINTGVVQRKSQTYLDLNNLSIKVRAEGSFENIGLTHQAYFNKIIGTYSGLTGVYPASDGYEAGFSVRMKQKAKKLSANLRGSIRNYSIPGFTDSRWKNSSLMARAMYKLKKGQYFQLSLNQQDGFKRYFLSGRSTTVRQQSRGLTADAMIVNKRLFGLYNTSYLSAGIQQDFFPLTGIPGKDRMQSKALNVMLNQVFLYREHLLQLNVHYTRVSQDIDALLYNTRMDADMGGTFQVNKNLTAGLSAVYGYLKGGYTNLGARITLSGMLWKRIEFDLNSDIRKNIELINPLFSRFFMLNCGLKYTIKK